MVDISHVPKDPGVYLFKDSKNTIIYVGKAKSLKKRVQSYFRKNQQSVKTKFLVERIKSVDFIVVLNEVEALLLENKLIKKHQPKYNIALKDGKTYAYICLTKEKFPRVYSARRVNKKDTFFGPYPDGNARWHVVQLTNAIFKLRTCRNLPKRACLQYHINLCTAPCIKNVSEEEYSKQVQDARKFLKGDTRSVISRLEQEMKEASLSQKYEIALEKRRFLESLHVLKQRQSVDTLRDYNQDVIALSRNEERSSIVLFSVNKGVISGKKVFTFDSNEEDLLQRFIGLYYTSHAPAREILLSEECYDTKEKQILEQYLETLRKGPVRLVVPKRGNNKDLVEIALRNAQLQSDNVVLKELQEKLNLPTLPHTIECFDISNLKDDHIVAGMTQWVGGLENKSGHRRFLIRSTKTQDDFAAMYEAVYRRYKKLEQQPDLIIIDGGKGQLGAALKALQDVGAHIPVISLAKQDEEIYVPGEDVARNYDNNSPLMLLLRAIRDSVHKYVLAYNRKRRSMQLRDSKKK